MTSSVFLRSFGNVMIAALVTNFTWSADSPRNASPNLPASVIVQRSGAGRGGPVKGPLPDPLLLDGSVHPAEKRSEYGMIGDFELPGTEDVRNGRVGGPQNPGQSGQQDHKMPSGAGGGSPMGLPRAGSAADGQQAEQQGGTQGGAVATAGQQQGSGAAAGAQGGAQQAGGFEGANAGSPMAGGGEAGAQPQGIQVSDLGGGAGQQGAAGGDGGGGRPQPVAIGDKAMRIEPSAMPPSVVGAQQKIDGGYVQQHEKTGTGGKPPAAPQGPGRVEKGRVMPSGL